MNSMKDTAASTKKAYIAPSVKQWGTVADLTKTGQTHEGEDGKMGSIAHSKGK